MMKTLRIAAYMRLSKEDEKIKTESNSISMQRVFIQEYVHSHFENAQILEYQDDGFSGTNFNRPGVIRLLEDAKNEKFDCIVVKDFSRFGRDYIELGSYLEQIFPFLGIRFISINDHYDSDYFKGGIADLDINFKNLIYDFYSKDLSRKVKTSLRSRKESGQYVSANAPFGYEKSLNDRHMLVICEDEAEIVKKIFSLTLQGMTSSQVAKELNETNIPTPIEFKIKKGKTSRKPKGDRFYWSSSVICNILRNPVYAGDIEYGKTEKEQVGGRNVFKARRDWKIIRNHHVPIITREDFERVQKNRGKIREKSHGRKKIQERQFSFTDSDMVILREKRLSLFQDLQRAKRENDRLKQENYRNYQSYSLGKRKSFHSLYNEIKKSEELILNLENQIIQIDKQMNGKEINSNKG